jgi:hypothetical protein
LGRKRGNELSESDSKDVGNLFFWGGNQLCQRDQEKETSIGVLSSQFQQYNYPQYLSTATDRQKETDVAGKIKINWTLQLLNNPPR